MLLKVLQPTAIPPSLRNMIKEAQVTITTTTTNNNNNNNNNKQ